MYSWLGRCFILHCSPQRMGRPIYIYIYKHVIQCASLYPSIKLTTGRFTDELYLPKCVSTLRRCPIHSMNLDSSSTLNYRPFMNSTVQCGMVQYQHSLDLSSSLWLRKHVLALRTPSLFTLCNIRGLPAYTKHRLSVPVEQKQQLARYL